MSSNNIILTGFMGSGKSTVGRILAKETNSYFLDTDMLIENFENKSIKTIFEKMGESEFRKMEKNCFEWIKNSVKNSVISVGGGFAVYIPQIKEAGTVIYLKVEFEDIVKRMNKKEIKKRPLFNDLKKTKKLYDKRDKIYSRLADFIIENKDIKESIEKIKRIINES